MRFSLLTLYPEMFPGPLGQSLAGSALEAGKWSLDVTHIRDFATDRHRTVDDTPYGGGSGMVMRADVLDRAIVHAKTAHPGAPLIYFTPRGRPLTQALVRELLPHPAMILLCGRFEGVDERLLEAHSFLEVSLGDFVLSGGEIAAYALMDACVRLLPGVMGGNGSAEEESFGTGEFAGLLEYPHYTRPAQWQGRNVPEVLLSGHHEAIRTWRLEQARETTRKRRPDVWEKYLSERG